MEDERFHNRLKKLMDAYVHYIYAITKKFPRDEIYGVTSQLRRAAMSVGSLKESKYLLHFSLVEEYITKDEYAEAMKYAEEIGAMLWSTLKNLTPEQ